MKFDLEYGFNNQSLPKFEKYKLEVINDIKYVVRIDSRNQDRMKSCLEDIKQLEETENAEILYSNENGFVAKIR